MKTRIEYSVLTVLLMMLGLITASGQMQYDREEVPGDNFSLEGALELFKRSKSPEEFEQLLNSSDNKVNNLDLNGDRDIDYIKVIDRNEGNVHAFILQAVVSPSQSQDIAVIELETLGNGKAVLQIVGDADVYGIETIIEPTEEVRVNAGASTSRNVVNVWAWPSVQYVYSPYYAAWMSPWGWSMRPMWWHPWRPVSYYVYNPYWAPYRPYYSVCHVHRNVYAHNIYRPYRTSSVIVYDRHRPQIAHYRSTYGSNSHRGDRSYRDGHESNNSRTDSYRHSSNETRGSSTSQPGNSRSTGRNSDEHRTSRDVTRRPDAIEMTSPSSRDRSSTVHRNPGTSQRSSTEPRLSTEPRRSTEGRSHSTFNRSTDVQRRPAIVQPRQTEGRQRTTVQQDSRARGIQPVQRPGGGGSGGSGGSGAKKRGRH